MEFQFPGFGYKAVPKNVIQVAMGIEQHFGLKLMVGNECFQLEFLPLIIAARVNNETFPGFIKQYIGVFRNWTKLEMVDC
jgi:hypothetical protein